ncbi:MAG: S1 RNA-binding domain-containing protein [Planctomycetia bacterium]|nr:S1 RNA-binding domain-containing protein [Planctomycetia bacterium]
MEQNEKTAAADAVAPETPVTPNISASPEPTANAPEPLPVYDSLNANAPVVNLNVIAERLRKAREARGETAGSSGRAGDSRGRKNARSGQRTQGEGGQDGASVAGADSSEGDSGEVKRESRRNDRRRRERSDAPMRPRGPERPQTNAVLPNRREALSDDQEEEFNAIFGGEDIIAEMASAPDSVIGEELEEGAKVTCTVESIQGESVFVNVGARELGLIPLKQFPDDYVLERGQTFEAVVTRYNRAEGVYDVALPFAAADVGDWMSITKGAVVEARVTGANTGGLECAVGNLRGFMPFSQIHLFHVDNPEQFVGESWKCIVTEVNPERRNLIVSRRELLKREREELRDKTWAELVVGETREGLVRKIIPVGVFVDLGGVDGFIPISELSWGRVKDPSEVVKEGDRVKVTIKRVDRDRDRVSLSLKDLATDPWDGVNDNVDLQVGSIVSGRVVSIQDFGAFVELQPGVEGLVHISEIAYKRVARVSDALMVGDVVNVKIIGVDTQKRKISLSIKQTAEDPREVAKREAAEKADADAAAAKAEEEKKNADAERRTRERINQLKSNKPLKGGIGSQDDNPWGLRL